LNYKVVSALFVLIVCLAGLIFVDGATAGSASLKEHTMCTGVDKSDPNDWKPIDPRDRFSTADKSVTAFVVIENVVPPVDIKFVWVAPHEFSYNNKVWSRVVGNPITVNWEGWGWVYDGLTIERDDYTLPVGFWKSEVYANDQLISTVEFALVPSVDLVSKTFEPGEGEPVLPGDVVTATYKLENTGLTPLLGAEFTAETVEGVTLVEATPPKDMAPGTTEEFVVKLKVTEPGEYKVMMNLYINKELIEGAPLEITVSEKPFWENPMMIGGIVFVAAIVLAALVLLMRKRGAAQPKAPAPPSYAPPPAVQAPATKYCINCGASIPPEARFCPACAASQG